jgi:hypothetical protein
LGEKTEERGKEMLIGFVIDGNEIMEEEDK